MLNQKATFGANYDSDARENDLKQLISRPIYLEKQNQFRIQLLQPALTENLSGKSKQKIVLPLRKPRPGDAFTMFLVKGDFNLGATCTITYVTQNKFWGCGHPVLGNEHILLPAYRTEIASSFKSPINAFKLVGNEKEPIGLINYDKNFAVEGEIQEPPKNALLPVKLQLNINDKGHSRKSEFEFSVFQHKIYTELLISDVSEQLLNNLWNRQNLATTHSTSQVTLSDRKPIKLYDASMIGNIARLGPFIMTQSPWSAVSKTASLVGYLMASSWNFQIQKVQLDINLEPGNKVLFLDSYKVLDKNNQATDSVSLGDEVKLLLGLRNNDGTKQFVAKIPLKIPASLKIKREQLNFQYLPISIFVESGNNFSEKDQSKLLDHRPENKKEFLKALLINQRDPQKLFIQMLLPRSELPPKTVPEPEQKSTGTWTPVKTLNFLRAAKTVEQKVITSEIESPLKDHVLNIQIEFILKLFLEQQKPNTPTVIPAPPLIFLNDDESLDLIIK